MPTYTRHHLKKILFWVQKVEFLLCFQPFFSALLKCEPLGAAEGGAEAPECTFLKYRLLTQHYPDGTEGSPPTIQLSVHTLPILIVEGRRFRLAEEYGVENLIFHTKSAFFLPEQPLAGPAAGGGWTVV